LFLSYEPNQAAGDLMTEVYFDDFQVTHVKSPVIQTDDYYPFGLTYNSFQREKSIANHWKFQGQEYFDELNLGWNSFKWRNQMPEIGRFFNIDPIAEDYYYNSPYAFSENKVVAHREIEGLESQSIHREIQKAEVMWNNFVDKVDQTLDSFIDAVTPDKQIGKTDIEKKNSQAIPVKEDQKDGGVSKTDVPSDVDGVTGPQFNPDATVKGKGGEDIMMHENGQKRVENPDKVPENVTRDTVGVTGNVDENGNTYNSYYIIQNGQDTIDQRGYVPSNMMPKSTVPAQPLKK
jgi:RHS repeat-associated protein